MSDDDDDFMPRKLPPPRLAKVSPRHDLKRKNSPRCTADMTEWPKEVLLKFSSKLESNLNSLGGPYWVEAPLRADDPQGLLGPPELQKEHCYYPAGSNNLMVVFDKQEYQRPLHRVALQISQLERDQPLLTSKQQASHRCPDAINSDGRGQKHCLNARHLAVEDDATNKSRQRCAGWVWIQPFKGHEGGYWYPTCTHDPVCLVYTPKSVMPTLLLENESH